MEFLNALLLGIVEGLTEFLPVSSTGHLILAGELLGFDGPPGKVFEIVIQLGAILAIVWLYREKFLQVARSVDRNRQSQHFVRNIAIAFLPAVMLGALAHDYIKSVLFNTTVVAWALIGGGVAIVLIEKIKPVPRVKSTEAMDWKTALAIGLFQCVSMIPGVSRAGATIMGALLCKVERKAAAEFSFFLAVPTMLAATSYDLYKNYDALSNGAMGMLAVGFVAAFLTAIVVVKWLVGFIQHHDFTPFAYYRIIVGALMLGLLSA